MDGVALGIDHGTARIGVAASDPVGILASPIETIEVAKTEPVARITELVSERAATAVVVGLPLRMDGTEGSAAEKVRSFIATLEPALPSHVRIVTVDERLSTQEAHERISQGAGKRRRSRDNRDVIDQAAAVIILQDYLDNLGGFAPPGPDG